MLAQSSRAPAAISNMSAYADGAYTSVKNRGHFACNATPLLSLCHERI